jgi:hypothetical protein
LRDHAPSVRERRAESRKPIHFKGVNVMPCPDCGSSTAEFRVAEFIETHGLDCGPYERFYEEFVICSASGGRFDHADWAATGEASGLENDAPEDVSDEANFNAENHAMSGT